MILISYGPTRCAPGKRDPDPPLSSTVSYQDARARGDTALSSPCRDFLALMRRVVVTLTTPVPANQFFPPVITHTYKTRQQPEHSGEK
ncbi:hypothetical protein F511_32968 [Dorcoceras hygrometricum]|uniref:Uncharacterized protein n=1 Tax=Dorcoceras hygrometricum TaxID=472368 RepID=A0A2Z7BMR2_9LAMI|nr:hypothetical protein F511_32968 [Dorcoceras hygrometricum]